jgi:hypothetical protein
MRVEFNGDKTLRYVQAWYAPIGAYALGNVTRQIDAYQAST